MKIQSIYIFCIITMVAGTAYALSFLQQENFPKTAQDASFIDMMDILTEGYENYAELTPYQMLSLIENEEISHAAIDAINEQSGIHCDNDTPTQDGSTYDGTQQQKPEPEKTEQSPEQKPESKPAPEQPQQNPPAQNSQGNINGYCGRKQPEIPQNQSLPLGSPVYFADLPQSATDRSRRIARNSKNGKFCSPYGCREKYNNRGHYRPHQGIDIGCTADYFGMPVYTPANGTVVSVIHAQHGKSAGNYIRIRHTDGWETQYMHLDRVFVTQGQQVQAGCSIGILGHTGGNADSRNPTMSKDISHLHYEILYNGRASTFSAPNGRQIPIVRGGDRSCGNFKTKIKPNDFVTYYYK